MDEVRPTQQDHVYRAFVPAFPRPKHEQPVSSQTGWQSRFDPRNSGLWLTSPGPFSTLEAFRAEAHSRAEQRLDILSVMGAGHHVIPYRNRDVLAIWEREGRQELLIRSPFITSMPFAIRSRATEDRHAGEPETTIAKYHPSMRYFRLAQVSADSFGCFVYLYRSLESILDEIHPHETTREKAWFASAITIALKRCRPHTVEALGVYSDPDYFAPLVYETVRNGLFHAKTKSRSPLTPLDAEATALVRKAARLVSLVIADLLKPYLPIGRGEIIATDLDIHEHSEISPNLRGMRLLLNGGQRHDIVFPFSVIRDDEHLGHLLVSDRLLKDKIPKAHLVGVEVVSTEGAGPQVVFDRPIETSLLDSLTVQIFMTAEFELGHRTNGGISEEGVRVAPRRA